MVNENAPRCFVCGEQVGWQNRITVEVKSWYLDTEHKEAMFTNTIKQKIRKKYNFHKSCYKDTIMGELLGGADGN